MVRRIFFRLSLIFPFFIGAYFVTFYILLRRAEYFLHIVLSLIITLILGSLFIIPRVKISRSIPRLLVQLCLIATVSFSWGILTFRILFYRPVPFEDILKYSLLKYCGLFALCIFSSLSTWTRRWGTAILFLFGVAVLEFVMLWGLRGFSSNRTPIGLSIAESLMPISLVASLILGDLLDFKKLDLTTRCTRPEKRWVA